MRISASFDTFDEAENCARHLKHHCEGIQAIRIRPGSPGNGRPAEPMGDPPAAVVPFALYNSGGADSGMMQGLAPGTAPYGSILAYDLALDDGPSGEGDGPAGRTACRMDVLVLPESSRAVEQAILSQHGRRISRIQL